MAECQKTSGQSNLTKRRIAAAHVRFNRIRQVAPMCTPSNMCFLVPTRVHTPNGISIGSAVFAHLTAECLYTLQRAAPSPSKSPFRMGDLNPRLIHGFLGPLESTTKTASRTLRWIQYRVCDAWPVRRQTYGYLPSQISLHCSSVGTRFPPR